jgi:hypothetical protein
MQVLDQKDLADAEERRRVWEKNAKKGGSKAAPKKQRKKPAAKQPKVESDTEGMLQFCVAYQFFCYFLW